MKIISWNVNGIRSVMKKGFSKFVHQENPDILCLQEIKSTEKHIDQSLENYEHHYWNPADKKGYAGTAVFSKKKPLSVMYGKELMNDNEGRVIVLELEKFYLINVYTPNSQRELARLDYRLDWDKRFLKMILKLNEKKGVVICGDLNVAHKEIDIKNPKTNLKNAGFTLQERKSFDNYISSGLVDSFRKFNSEPDNYTWWSPMFGARDRNIGWRIDYFLADKKVMKEVVSSSILASVKGSDHCPVVLELKYK